MTYIKFSEFFDTYFYWIGLFLTNIGEFCIAHESTIITLLIGIATLYLACYAIAWAKYEFHITRQSQQVSVFAALCATNDAKRISFAPSLSHMTQKKLPKYPTLMTPSTIISGLFRVQNNEKELTEYNFDTIDTVSKIIKGFDNWKGANFNWIILNGTHLPVVPLDGAYLELAHFERAILWGAHLDGAILDGAHLMGTHLNPMMISWNEKGQEINDEITDPQLIQKCVELLSPAKTLFEANLPKPVEKILREKYPHLFEPPA